MREVPDAFFQVIITDREEMNLKDPKNQQIWRPRDPVPRILLRPDEYKSEEQL